MRHNALMRKNFLTRRTGYAYQKRTAYAYVPTRWWGGKHNLSASPSLCSDADLQRAGAAWPLRKMAGFAARTRTTARARRELTSVDAGTMPSRRGTRVGFAGWSAHLLVGGFALGGAWRNGSRGSIRALVAPALWRKRNESLPVSTMWQGWGR